MGKNEERRKFDDLMCGDDVYVFTDDILYKLTIFEVEQMNDYAVRLKFVDNMFYIDYFNNTGNPIKTIVGRDADVYFYRNNTILFADKETVRDYLETLKKRIDIMIGLL